MATYRDYKEIIQKKSILLNEFPEICKYSCSKNGELRKFGLYREYYEFKFWKISFKFLETIKVECQNCHWKARLPARIARKIFKKGLKANTLIRYSRDRILSSFILNYFADLWRIFGIGLMILLIFIGLKYYSENVYIGDIKTVTFNDLKGGRSIGQTVKITGKVDYTLALTKDDIEETRQGRVIVSTNEVYLPIFSPDEPNEYILLRGGPQDVQNVLGRQGVANPELLKGQDYAIIGKVQSIDFIDNEDIKKFYTEELPKSRASNPPTIVVDNIGLISLNDFLMRYLNYAIALVTLLVLTLILQIYIDRRVFYK
jgi:hypothetical protein